MSDEALKKSALEYHRQYPPGKFEITATKPMSNRHDLSLAYSPGVAAACEEIVRDPEESFTLTGRANQVAVITNGTAVLGLGNIGPLAAKPVMEGKAVLFKRFAGINALDIELDVTDVDKFCDIVAAMEPTFGGINLEDIKAPECFEIEKRLRKKMNIPVFHDDQHGTAIIATAGLINALSLIDKKLEEIQIVCNGAGAAGISILDMFCALGAHKENILLCDSKGVAHDKRTDLNIYKKKYAKKTEKRSLADAVDSTDVFIGVSVAGALSVEMLKSMNRDPVVFALANPNPEIMPDLAKKTRSDVIVATGRTDFPNQINNVLCFPFLFRGALDVGATIINQEMMLACAQALANLAKKEADESTAHAYSGEDLLFSKNMLIPKPFDIRLIEEISTAVAQAAIESGVAKRPIGNMREYRKQLRSFVNRSSIITKRVISNEEHLQDKKIIFADGEDQRVLNAARMMINDCVAKPVLIGRAKVIQEISKQLGLSFNFKEEIEIIDPSDYQHYDEFHQFYHKLNARRGVLPEIAEKIMRSNSTAIGSMLLRKNGYDSLVCGLAGRFVSSLQQIQSAIDLQEGVTKPVAIDIVLLGNNPLFIADTRVSKDPDVERLVEITLLASEVVKEFDLTPKIGMISHSTFGSAPYGSALKMCEATRLVKERYPNLQIEGEMGPDAALDETLRNRLLPGNSLKGSANLLIMPNVEVASISYRVVSSSVSDGFTLGPLYAGLTKPVSILDQVSTARSIYNLAVVSIRQKHNLRE